MKKKFNFAFILFLLSISLHIFANEISSTIYTTSKPKRALGSIVFTDTPYGLLITPALTGLPSGIHGFHLHQKANCTDKGMMAGGHFDPNNTNSHQGPYKSGHLGDLPALIVPNNGIANTPLLAPRLTTKDLFGLAIIIHAGGDNYTDQPTLGGGGERLGCGLIKSKIKK